MNLCLNMIVRNESARIERALKSAAPYIRSWVICDTGSTDDTKDKIVRFFRDLGIPGELRDVEFKDFSQARNEALTWGRKLHFAYAPTHFLLMDADMELVVKDPVAFGDLEGGICWEMDQQGGTVTYANKRILSAVGKWYYKGVTHEFLDAPSTGAIPRGIAMFVDHADGSNRDKKFARDIRLLKRGLKDEPTNERYFYYLASSYRDAGKHAEAAKWFQRRVRAGGWDEEVWSAQVGYAHALKDLGDEPGFIRELLVAYNMRPQRAEAMYDLAHHLRLKDIPLAAHAVASAVEHTPLSQDRLFVNEFPYKVGIRQELAITSFYVPGQMEHGRRLNDELTLERNAWPAVANEARANQFFYLPKLETVAPSFRYHNIAFTPPDDLVPLNPSVVSHLGRFLVNVRAVNYRIDDDGRYIIKATDGTANADNPIDTRNFILDFGCDPESAPFCPTFECYRPGNMPVEWPLVTGFEDVRLISFADALWGSATVRQLCADGQCEQVLTKIVDARRWKDEPPKSASCTVVSSACCARRARPRRTGRRSSIHIRSPPFSSCGVPAWSSTSKATSW
jgi:glycosyltransferase involved in cell wall biosynthesis